MIQNLLGELKEQILDYCNVADLLNLACCSSQCYDDCIKQMLWHSVSIEPPYLKHNPLPLLKYTKRLHVVPCVDEVGRTTDVLSTYVHMHIFGPHLDLERIVELHIGIPDGPYFREHFCDADIQYICRYLISLKVLFVVSSHNAPSDVVSENVLVDIDQLHNLEELTLHSFSVKEVKVNTMSSLKKMVLNGCRKIRNSTLRHLKDLSKLEVLEMWDCSKITDNGILNLQGLSSLSILRLHNCRRVKDDSLLPISGLTQLRQLDLFGASITSSGVAPLRSLIMLEYLNLSYTRFNDASVEYMIPMKRLRQLLVQNTWITDMGIHVISTNLFDLEELNIRNCFQLSNSALQSILRLGKLKSLDISRAAYMAPAVIPPDRLYTDTAIQNLSHLQNLEVLAVADCRGITAAAFVGFPKIRKLYLWSTGMTDGDLETIGEMATLEFLDLSGNPLITDAGLDHLTSLTSLEFLELRFTNITKEGEAKLQCLPKLKTIHRDIDEDEVEHLADEHFALMLAQNNSLQS